MQDGQAIFEWLNRKTLKYVMHNGHRPSDKSRKHYMNDG